MTRDQRERVKLMSSPGRAGEKWDLSPNDREALQALVIAYGRRGDALRAIGKNTCGCEPLAAAYARGVLAEENEALRSKP